MGVAVGLFASWCAFSIALLTAILASSGKSFSFLLRWRPSCRICFRERVVVDIVSGSPTPWSPFAVLCISWGIGYCASCFRCKWWLQQPWEFTCVTVRQLCRGIEGCEKELVFAVLGEKKIVDDIVEALFEERLCDLGQSRWCGRHGGCIGGVLVIEAVQSIQRSYAIHLTLRGVCD